MHLFLYRFSKLRLHTSSKSILIWKTLTRLSCIVNVMIADDLVTQGDRVSAAIPDSKAHGTNMGPIWGRQGPGGPHVGPMNIAIWDFIDLEYSQNIPVSAPESLTHWLLKMWLQYKGVISKHMLVMVSFRFYDGHHYKILHQAWQLCCESICLHILQCNS